MFAGIGIECTVGRARLGVWCQREAVEVGINPQILSPEQRRRLALWPAKQYP